MSIAAFIKNIRELVPGIERTFSFAVLFAALASIVYPVPIIAGWHVLCLLMQKRELHLLAPSLVALASIVLCIACRLLSSWNAHVSAARVSRALRLKLMEHLGKLVLHWFSCHSTGELKKVLNTDVGEIDRFIAHNVTDIISALCLPFISILIMVWVDWRLALALAALLTIAVYIQIGSYRDVHKSRFMEQYNAAQGMLHADSVDFIQGMPDIKIFNRSTESFSRMRAAVEKLDSMQDRVVSFYAVRWGNYLSVIAAPLAVLSSVGGWMYIQGSLTLERFILAIILGSLALVPLVSLLRFSAFVMRARYCWLSIQAILLEPVEVSGTRNREEVSKAELVVKNLCASYEGKPVLQNVSFTASPGTVTAVVGMSGSGKSTLAAVLAGLEKIDQGNVLLGGVPINELPASELAACFSVVFQRPFIFTGSVADNIRLGSEDASLEEVKQAAAMTHAAAFIESLPNGYDTVIGGGGEVHLSGGQAQRVALARMALRNPPVVLLDEATAFADPESEAAIQKGLAAFLSDKTVIIIAHRLRSIANSDNILVLDQGQIVQSGRHEEIIKEDGVYARLWEADSTARVWTIRNTSAPQ